MAGVVPTAVDAVGAEESRSPTIGRYQWASRRDAIYSDLERANTVACQSSDRRTLPRAIYRLGGRRGRFALTTLCCAYPLIGEPSRRCNRGGAFADDVPRYGVATHDTARKVRAILRVARRIEVALGGGNREPCGGGGLPSGGHGLPSGGDAVAPIQRRIELIGRIGWRTVFASRRAPTPRVGRPMEGQAPA